MRRVMAPVEARPASRIVSMEIFARLLENEEGHIDCPETQLDLNNHIDGVQPWPPLGSPYEYR